MSRLQLRHIRRRFAGDSRGVVAVEFGLILLPLFMLVFGMIQTSYDFFLVRMLDETVEKAARKLMVGTASNDLTGLRDSVCKTATVISCDKLILDVETVSAFADPDAQALLDMAAPPSIADAAYDVGGSGKYHLVQAFYPAPVFSLFGSTRGVTNTHGQWSRIYRATAVIRME